MRCASASRAWLWASSSSARLRAVMSLIWLMRWSGSPSRVRTSETAIESPEIVAEPVAVPLLDLVGADLSVQQLLHDVAVPVEIVRVRDVPPRHGAQLVRGATDELAERVVDLEKAAVQADDCHADRGRLERRPEPLLALEQRLLRAPALAEVADEAENPGRLSVLEQERRRDLDRHGVSVAGQEHRLVPGQLRPGLEPPPELRDRLVSMLGGDQLDGEPSDQLAGLEAGEPLARRVDRGESPLEIERADHVVDMAEQHPVQLVCVPVGHDLVVGFARKALESLSRFPASRTSPGNPVENPRSGDDKCPHEDDTQLESKIRAPKKPTGALHGFGAEVWTKAEGETTCAMRY